MNNRHQHEIDDLKEDIIVNFPLAFNTSKHFSPWAGKSKYGRNGKVFKNPLLKDLTSLGLIIQEGNSANYRFTEIGIKAKEAGGYQKYIQNSQDQQGREIEKHGLEIQVLKNTIAQNAQLWQERSFNKRMAWAGLIVGIAAAFIAIAAIIFQK